MPVITHSVLPIDIQAKRLGYKFVTEDERKAQLPYSVLIESARQNLPADHPERQRLDKEAKISQQYAERPRIEITERDFNSDNFLQAIAHVCKWMRNECAKLERMGRLNPKSELAKMYYADEIEEHYIKVQGAFCYFKKEQAAKEEACTCQHALQRRNRVLPKTKKCAGKSKLQSEETKETTCRRRHYKHRSKQKIMAKKTKPAPVRCIDCAKAEIHQWHKNPLIAFCCGNPEKRTVASTPCICSIHEPRTSPITDNDIIHHI